MSPMEEVQHYLAGVRKESYQTVLRNVLLQLAVLTEMKVRPKNLLALF
uniref:Uncharacterized protein n=1 Tax=Megaselia scalaris TaxID=36166 RepID=T1H1V6_MEGSC